LLGTLIETCLFFESSIGKLFVINPFEVFVILKRGKMFIEVQTIFHGRQ